MLRSDGARAAALACQGGLIVGLWVWCGWLAGGILSLPLLLGLRGLWRRRRYTYQWLSLLLVLYAAGLLAESYAIHSRHRMGLLLAALAVGDFVSVSLFARWSARERLASAARTAESDAVVP